MRLHINAYKSYDDAIMLRNNLLTEVEMEITVYTQDDDQEVCLITSRAKIKSALKTDTSDLIYRLIYTHFGVPSQHIINQ